MEGKMKEKVARRWLRRNEWKIVEHKINGTGSKGFWKFVVKCRRANNEILYRKFD